MRQDLPCAGMANAQKSSARKRIVFAIFKLQNSPITKLPICSELNLHRLAVGLGSLEELPWREVKHPGNNVRRKRLNLRIQVADYGVVIAPRVLNRILGLVQ